VYRSRHSKRYVLPCRTSPSKCPESARETDRKREAGRVGLCLSRRSKLSDWANMRLSLMMSETLLFIESDSLCQGVGNSSTSWIWGCRSRVTKCSHWSNRSFPVRTFTTFSQAESLSVIKSVQNSPSGRIVSCLPKYSMTSDSANRWLSFKSSKSLSVGESQLVNQFDRNGLHWTNLGV